MKTLRKSAIALSLMSLSIAASPASAALVVTADNDAGSLIGELLGPGITLVGGSESIIGAATQSGTFTGGLSAGLGFDSGILLTSGDALDAPGPNSADNTSTTTGTGSNAQLEALVPGINTNDQNVLSFSFETSTGDVFFQFQFASEEYNEYVGSQYNDPFGLFVDGVNIAEAPNGDPVAINTVNCGDPFGSADNNCASFNNNDISDGGPFFNIEYDGFTDAFLASITGLGAGVHTMVFAIADAGDTAWDSAVFIEKGSFGSVNPVSEPGMLALLGLGLIGIGAARRRRKL